jgi:F-type H+-transporting ATPase subunit b
MQIISTTALISINGTLIAQVVSFLIFLFIINRIMIRPLQNSMAERDNHIEQMKQDIVDADKDVENISMQLEERKSAVIEEALGITKELDQSGSKKADEIFVSARSEVAALKEKATKEVDAQLAEATKHLKKESEALAINVMEKILDRRLAS